MKFLPRVYIEYLTYTGRCIRHYKNYDINFIIVDILRIDKVKNVFDKNIWYLNPLIYFNFICHFSQAEMSDFDLMMQKKKIVRTALQSDVRVFRNLLKVWNLKIFYFGRWTKKLEREGMRYWKNLQQL